MLEEKIFRQVENHPQYYISQDGELISYKQDKKNGKFIKPYLHQATGYYCFTLDGKTELLHRLIAKAFIPNPKNLETVNHKNHIKTDNRIENLEWMSQSDNTRDARLNDYTVYSTIDGYVGRYRGQKEVADKLGISYGYFKNLCYQNKIFNEDIIMYKEYVIHKEKKEWQNNDLQ